MIEYFYNIMIILYYLYKSKYNALKIKHWNVFNV